MDLEALPHETAVQMTPLLPAPWWKGKKVFPVVPTAHFCMGGVVTDKSGNTGMRGLWAVGEVAAGAHGANRLGGNALAEIFTLGAVVGEVAGIEARANRTTSRIGPMAKAEKLRLEKAFSTQGLESEKIIQELKKMMWKNAGIIQCHTGLSQATDMLCSPCPGVRIASPSELIRYLEFLNMRLVSEMICIAALKRTESRGSHFRSDFPKEDNPYWLKNIRLQKGKTGIQCHAVDITPTGLSNK